MYLGAVSLNASNIYNPFKFQPHRHTLRYQFTLFNARNFTCQAESVKLSGLI